MNSFKNNNLILEFNSGNSYNGREDTLGDGSGANESDILNNILSVNEKTLILVFGSQRLNLKSRTLDGKNILKELIKEKEYLINNHTFNQMLSKLKFSY